MSEIEMTHLRAAMYPSPEAEHSGDSSSAQERLLAGPPPANGHGNGTHGYPPYNHHQHKHLHHHHSHHDLGAPRPRPVTGSGVVFRRRRTPCWCVLLVLVAVGLLAGGISLGVLFGVMRTESGAAGGAGGGERRPENASTTASKPAGGVSNHDKSRHGKVNESRTVTDSYSLPLPSPSSASSSSSSTTLRTPSLPSGSDVGGGGAGSGGRGNPSATGWGVSVRRFKAYWHPGDSRVMEVLLSNGTVLQATGHKGNDGTFRGLYSLSLTDGQGRTSRVRFMGGRSLASVILPHGTVVSLDWSANNADIECKVFQIPPPRGAPGGGPGGSPDVLVTPTSHLATLTLGVHSYLLRQISRTLHETSVLPGAWGEEGEQADAEKKQEDSDSTGKDTASQTPRFCSPRLPVKVTKCGGQYPYDGAFVQGEVTLQTGPPLSMAALPWPRQDDDDECYREFRGSSPNFFIPLPGHVERSAARSMAGRFWRTAAKWWGRVCGVVGTVLEVDLERHKVCANMAASAQTQLSHSGLYSVVYDSCWALLNSLHLACKTLDDLTARAAAAASRGGSVPVNSAGASGGRGRPREPPIQELLHRVLANATSLQEPATLQQQDVHIKTFAFCPSTQPLASFDKSLTLRASAGGVFSRDVRREDMVHVNCPGHPEVTYFYLGHAAAIHPLDMVKHRLKVCAVCALDKTFSVHVQRDHMCCNDTCSRLSRCEDSISEARVGLGLSESHTFTEQNSVYCHEFLTAADTPTHALQQGCLGTCQSNLEVRFQVKDAEEEGGGPLSMQGGGGGRVYLDQVLTCLEGYRSTCKSTFGH